MSLSDLVSHFSYLWSLYKANRAHIVPLLTCIGAALVAIAALKQARTASERHQAQTNADQERRITESFSKAVEQLGSDKREVRLGGIYTLERISQESEREYWPIMETLTAYVRERAPWEWSKVVPSRIILPPFSNELRKEDHILSADAPMVPLKLCPLHTCCVAAEQLIDFV